MLWQPEALFVLGAVLKDLRDEGVADLVISDEVLLEAASEASRLPAVAMAHKALVPVHRAVRSLLPGSELEQGLARRVKRQTLECMQLAALTGQIVSTLEESDCQPIAIKGVALSQVTTGDITSRAAGDVDVLVPAHRMTRALQVLKQMGARAATSEEISFRIHATTLDYGATRVDLHHRLTSCPYVAQVPHDELLERGRRISMAGYSVTTLGDRDLAMYTALVGTIDAWSQIVRLADMARVAPVIKSDPANREVAADWGIGAALGLALAMLRRIDTEIPRQDLASEALANRTWRLIADGRMLRWESARPSLIEREVYQVMATRRVAHTLWLGARSAEVGVKALLRN